MVDRIEQEDESDPHQCEEICGDVLRKDDWQDEAGGAEEDHQALGGAREAQRTRRFEPAEGLDEIGGFENCRRDGSK